MGRKKKHRNNDLEFIARILHRDYNQELAGQTKLAHYHETKARMIECELCGVSGCRLHRHRIIHGGLYTDENIVIVCVPCHKLIHRIFDELGDSKDNYRFAIELARLEVK